MSNRLLSSSPMSSTVIHLLIVLILCQTTYSIIKSVPKRKRGQHDMCFTYREDFEKIEMLSIFNLHDYLMIQTRKPNTNKTEMWQIGNTEPVNPRHPEWISQHIRLHHLLLNDFFPTINHEINRTGHYFKDTMRITGHVMWAEKPYSNLCPDSDVPYFNMTNTKEPCYEILKVEQSGQLFMCLYGHEPDPQIDWKVVTYSPYIFDTYTGKILQITITANYWQMSQYCHNFHLHSKGIASIQYNQYFEDVDHPFPVSMKIDGKSPGTGLLQARSPPDFTFNMSVVYEHVLSLFHFNSYYQLYSCPVKCGFRSNLTKVEFLKPDRHGIKFDYKLTVLKLAQLIGCSKKVFDPHAFCQENRYHQNLISVFSLVNDIYYQKTGLFYRYRQDGFVTTAIHNEKELPHICPLRLDSDITGMLEEVGLDSSQPLVGFAIRRDMSKTTYYIPEALDCDREGTWQTCIYHLACFVGERTPFDPSLEQKVVAFKYYHSGVARFSTDEGRTWGNDSCNVIVSKIKGQYRNAEIAGVVFDDSQEKYNAIYAYVYDNDDYFVRMIQWPRYSGSDRISKMQDTIYHHSSFLFDAIGLFIFKGTLFAHVRYKHELWTTDKDKPELWKLAGYIDNFNVVDCPCNQSNSLITAKKMKPICDNLKPDNVNMGHSESAFNIGIRIYHQSGQRFYEFNPQSKRLAYNKYITDLFNDYFDTRFRISGYSPIIDKIQNELPTRFELMVHGKSSVAYRGLGEDIYALFDVYQENVNSTYLKAINIPTNVERHEADITLGILCPSVPPSLDGWAFFETIAGERTFSAVLMELKMNNVTLEYYLYTFENVDNDELYFPLKRDCKFNRTDSSKWKYNHTHILLEHDRLVGVIVDYEFNYWSGGMFLVARNSVNKRLTKYLFRKVVRGKIAPVELFRVNHSYHDDYCEHVYRKSYTPGQPGNAPSSNDTVSRVLGILVLVLLVIALLVALIAHYFNRKTHPSSQTTKTKEQTLPPESNSN